MVRRKIPSNQEIARMLSAMGLWYEADGEPWRPRAYETAAKSIAEIPEEMSAMFERCGEKCVLDIPGVGQSIEEKLHEIVTTGKSKDFERMAKKHPYDIVDITSVEGVGPKTAMHLFKALGVKSLKDLETVAQDGRIAKLPGFGEASQRKILEGIQFHKKSSGRVLLSVGLELGTGLVAKLKKVHGVTNLDVCGSIRRRKETVGDIDLIAAAKNPKKLLDAFVALPQVEAVLERGPSMVMVRFKNGLDGDLLVLPPEVYGAALLHFTGGREHNIQIRQLAIKHGWTLSERGLMHGRKLLAGASEEEIYAKLKMQFIPPEMREGRGEVEAALHGKLPNVVEYGSLQGDLQVTTSWTDGDHSIEEMARAAKAAGLKYIAITDHTRTLAMTGGLTEADLVNQGKEIDAVNKKIKDFKILKSAEINILKDGSLDIDDEALKKLEVVCVAVHTHFHLSRAEQTKRIITAMKHPRVQILFHPTARKINERPPIDLDIGQIIRAAKQYGVALEANGSPDRLDLSDGHIRLAVEEGVKLVIDSDSHNKSDFAFLDYGLGQARRGWATSADILNTRPLKEFLRALR